ncbi:MAG: ATP-binding protein [Acidaminobacteraceae bacterium]
MIAFINETIKINFIEDKQISLFTQGNIVANQLEGEVASLNKQEYKNLVEKSIKKQSIKLKSRILVVNVDGFVLIDSYDDYEGRDLSSLDQVAAALIGESTRELYQLEDNEKVIYLGLPIITNGEVAGVVLMVSSIEDIFVKVNDVIEKILLLSILGLLVTGIVSFIFADIISSPVENMTLIVKRISRGNFDEKIELEGDDELTKLGEAINSMTVKLHQVDDQRKKFVSNVSHELRTPLASMKIISESLLLGETWDESIYREFLGDIDSEIDRLSKIIDSLLYLVDIEKKDMILEYEYTDLNIMIRSIVKQLKPLADHKDIKIKFIETEHATVKVDSHKIHQSLINIIGNAIKYTPKGGVVTVKMYRVKEDVMIEIKDNGIGIPEKDQVNIFDRFYRVDEARARNTGGNGLGLSIAQQIIHLHQGEITLESSSDKGTTFFIKLPTSIKIWGD